MGTAILAFSRDLGTHVIVKKIPDRSLGADREARLARYRQLASLQHPLIVRILDVVHERGCLYIVMPFVSRQTLDQKLARDGQFAPKAAARLVLPLAEALHYAHEQGVLHGDVKPGNVLIDDKGQPHWTDFGLIEEPAGGATGGTPGYVAPELIAGRARHSRQADVYSLGVTLFELLTGRRPFTGSLVERLTKQAEKPAPSPRRFDPAVPAELEAICLKALARDPGDRYATALDLAEDLKRYLAFSTTEAAPTPPDPGRREDFWKGPR
jgi:serine/threonine-protein kinase